MAAGFFVFASNNAETLRQQFLQHLPILVWTFLTTQEQIDETPSYLVKRSYPDVCIHGHAVHGSGQGDEARS
jgi:alanine racemase